MSQDVRGTPNARDCVWEPRLVRFEGDEAPLVARAPAAQAELDRFRNVTNSVVQDALNVWADIWAELEDSAAAVPKTGAESRFLEKMWVLRQNLDFLARLSRQ